MPLSSLFPATRWSVIHHLDERTAAAGVLLEHYVPAIRAYLGLKFSDQQAETIDDLAQEVLLDLLEQPAVLAKAAQDTGRRFRYYLMGVAYNLARNAQRRLRQRPTRIADDQIAVEAQSGNPTEQACMETAWAVGLVERACEDVRGWEEAGHLPPGSMAMVDESLFCGRGVRAIASVRDLSPATCARRIAAARQLLIKSLCDHLIAAHEMNAADGPDAAFALLRDAIQGRTLTP